MEVGKHCFFSPSFVRSNEEHWEGEFLLALGLVYFSSIAIPSGTPPSVLSMYSPYEKSKPGRV